ncbi:MAG: RidA family protein [Gammaproteobacteria bacterium]|nr:RidA family protein [Gammaproteobacteria bacterium]
MQVLQPAGWAKPLGYSNGVKTGNTLYVAGMIGWNAECKFETDDFVEQFRQTLINTVAVLKEGGAEPKHIVRMTCFITDKKEYISRQKEIGQAYREVLGKVFPPMAMLQVVALMEDRAKIEIETTAVIDG